MIIKVFWNSKMLHFGVKSELYDELVDMNFEPNELSFNRIINLNQGTSKLQGAYVILLM